VSLPNVAVKPSASSRSDAELVTLCAWTRTVRYDQEWISVEEYLERRYGVVTSHGISPAALDLLEAELASPPVPAWVPSEEAGSALLSPRRLAAVRATGLLDSASSVGFDRLTRMGARLLGVPATFISLVENHRDFYLSHCGFGEPLASERQLTGQTFCHFTIEQETPLAIADTRAHPVYRHVPTVESLGVAAYLGAPLVLLSGEVIGAFCAIDQVPRAWTETQIQDAVDLASLVVSEIELRQSMVDTHNHRT
jgi:GAF domain-containing protein